MDHTLLFRSIPGLLLVLTPDLRVADATDAYLHATMCDRREILGRYIFDVFPDDPADPGATGVRNLRASLERVLREQVPDVMAVQKYSLRRPGAADAAGAAFEERYWSPVNVPAFARDGRLAWIIHRVEDVTAFIQASDGDAVGAREPIPPGRAEGAVRRMAADVYQRAQELQEANRQLRATVPVLASARDQARAAEHRVSEILESITDAFYALDAEYRFTYVNRSAEVMWGLSREDLLGRSLWAVFPGLAGSAVHERLAAAMQQRTPAEFETRSLVSDRWIQVHYFPTGDGVSVYLRDITARREAEAERDRKDALARLLRDVAIAANDASGVHAALQAAIDSVCHILGWPVGRALLVGDASAPRVLPTRLWHADRGGRYDAFRRAVDAAARSDITGLVADVMRSRRPAWIARLEAGAGDGAGAAVDAGLRSALAVPVLVGRSVRAVLEFYCPDETPIDPTLLDFLAQVGTQLGRVVEREDAAAARRQMLERIVLAQEEERRRLARDIHDQMAQHLAALGLGVEALRPECLGSSDAQAKLDQLERLVERIRGEARDLAMSLRPVILDDFGLAAAIRDQVERWSAETAIPVVLHTAEAEGLRLPFSTETAVYRIVLEALTNVAKHAHARQVHVVLEHHDATLVAIVEDDGIGFDADAVLDGTVDAHGFGLVSMRERASLLGGLLAIESAPGTGTTVIARVPTAPGLGVDAREERDTGSTP